MDDMSGTRGGSGVRRSPQQFGDGERRGWSTTPLPTMQATGFSTRDARRGAGEMVRCQQTMEEAQITGTGIYFSDKRIAIATMLKEQGYLRGVSAPTDMQIRAACAERLLLVEEQYLTRRKDVLNITLVARARAAREGAIAAASRRTAINTSPSEGFAAITSHSDGADTQAEA